MVSLLVIGMLLLSAVPFSSGGECKSDGLHKGQKFGELPKDHQEAIKTSIAGSEEPNYQTPVEYFNRTKKDYKDGKTDVTQTFVNISTEKGQTYGRVYEDETEHKWKFFQFKDDERYRTVAKWCNVTLPKKPSEQ